MVKVWRKMNAAQQYRRTLYIDMGVTLNAINRLRIENGVHIRHFAQHGNCTKYSEVT